MRILLALFAVAGASTSFALVVQERTLSVDLREAARARLERACAAASRLVDEHLAGLAGRYQAIAGTPQFIANVEAGHAPTLYHFAEQLATRQAARAVVFLDRNGAALAHSGEAALVSLAVETLRNAALDMAPGTALVSHRGALHAAVAVPLQVGGETVGGLAVVEPITDAKLATWSELCGARLALGPVDDDLWLEVRGLGALRLGVAASLQTEREALANSRRSLLVVGLAAMLLALGVAVVVTRSLVRSLRPIRCGADRIRGGDFDFRLDESSRDEVGDIARAFNLMLDGLDQTQRRLAHAQRLGRLGNWRFDVMSGELTGSREFRRILGIAEDAPPLSLEGFLGRVHPEDLDPVRAAVDACLFHGEPLHVDHRIGGAGGLARVLYTYAERVDWGVLEGTVQDITDRKNVEEQIRYLAYHDSLTGLANRRLLKERLSLALEQARRSVSSVALLFLDVDRFKDINDTLGHSVGDELLLEVADRLAAGVAEMEPAGDAPDGAPLLARIGGDEFAVLLANVADRAAIERLATRLLDPFACPFRLQGQEVQVNASIGIAVAPDDGQDVETLLRLADTAMYHAKGRRRGGYQFFTDSMQDAARHRLVLANKLRQALANDELELRYQPKVDLHSGAVVGVEALARWQDPELGAIGPDEFIPLAEETGMISGIGEWVLRTAMRQAATWQADGLPPVRVAVNISVQQMDDRAGFVRLVSDLLEETGIDPRFLEFEITESTLLRDEEAAIVLMNRLRDIGIGLSLDDFGTGYSSLSYLRRLPIDTLKIDQSFVRRIETDSDDAALTGAIIGIARVLGLRVVVEGVETEAQREFLEALGCDEFQGFLFSTPVGAAEVTEMLRRQAAAEQGPRSKAAQRSPSRRRASAARAPVDPSP